jgi:hypothetical protein
MINPELKTRFLLLCDLVLEEQACALDIRELETLVLEHAELRELYAQYSHEHAALSVLVANDSPHFHPQIPPIPSDYSIPVIPAQKASNQQKRWQSFLILTPLLMLVAAGTYWFSTSRDTTFAVIEDCNHVSWDYTSIPSVVGQRFGQGRMKISSGILTLTFDCGALVHVESPAEIEFISPVECFLRQGRVLAQMDKGKSGFIVKTPQASFLDQGTNFGVSVNGQGKSQVQVFDGIVDATNNLTHEKLTVTTGHMAVVRGTDTTLKSRELDESQESDSKVPPAPIDSKYVQISTTIGQGHDQYIIRTTPDHEEYTYPSSWLLAKRSEGYGTRWDRKIYLAFDLSLAHAQDIEEAKLSLSLENSEIGFATRCPDAVFAVYGLTDESQDQWQNINWDNAPANFDSNLLVNPDQAVLLGKFVIPRGTRDKSYGVEGAELVRFLKRDTNHLATLIIVRETVETEHGGLVHAFGSSRSTDVTPPTLQLKIRMPVGAGH